MWALLTKTINVNILSVGLTTVAAIIMCVIAYINNNIARVAWQMYNKCRSQADVMDKGNE